MKGVEKVLDHYFLSMNRLIMINSLYEIETWCTSIISKMANGTILHSRNFDWGENADNLKKITYHAKFVKGTEHLFDAVMFGGNTNIYTGSKPKAFSISVNQRLPTTIDTPHIEGMIENMAMEFSGYYQIG